MKYEIPKEPDSGVVWDYEGQEWTRTEDGRWSRPSNLSMYWNRLLASFGPLTDTRPTQVGDEVPLTELTRLPWGTVARSRFNVYHVRADGEVYMDGSAHPWTPSEYFLPPMVTILHMGEYEEE